MLRIGLPENLSPDLLQYFPQQDVELVPLANHLEHETEIEFWIPPSYGRFAKPMFPRLHGVKVIQSLLAGVDWIVPWLPKGIVLCDGQGIHNLPVAEWVVGAILGAIKRFPEFRDRQREQFWDGQLMGGKFPGDENDPRSEPPPYRVLGDELGKKKILIVGYGGIGAEVERMLQPFDVDILRMARTAKPGVLAIADLRKILPAADVVVLLVPLTDQTRGLMNADALGRMKSGAILVNAARGPVVETDALLVQLYGKRLHAVLDVTDPEPLPKGHPLWSAPNCFITPHVAGSVERFWVRGYTFAGEQVRRYLAGEPLHNQVTAGY